MSSFCVELSVLGDVQCHTINERGVTISREDCGSWLLLPTEAEDALNETARQYRERGDFFGTIQNIASAWPNVPWAIVALDRDYALVGHLMKIKGPTLDLRFMWYSDKRKEPTHLSVLFCMNKKILEHLAAVSPLIAAPWQMLADKPEERHWFCLCDPLPQTWAEASEAVDADTRRGLSENGVGARPVIEKKS